MKKCRYCNKYYPESHFGVALTTDKKIYRRHKCRNCYRLTKNKLRAKYRNWLIDYKKEKKCQKCGIGDHRVLLFHHQNGDKEFHLSEISNHGCGINRIQKELAKCIVLCANCHRILHWEKLKENRKKQPFRGVVYR